MARPWEGKKYTEEEMEKYYGPKVAPNGITREAFYDRMVAQGWNRKGDDEIISSMYWLGCHNLTAVHGPDEGYLERMMNAPASNDQERNKLLNETTKLEINKAYNTSINNTIQSNVDCIINEENRSSFRIKMTENGYVTEDSNVLDILFECKEKQGNNASTSNINYNTTFQEGFPDQIYFFLMHNVNRAEANGWFDNEPEKLEALKKEKEVFNKRWDEKKKRERRKDYLDGTKVVRDYLKYAIEHGLDEVTDDEEPLDVDWGMDLDGRRVEMPADVAEAIRKDFDAIEIDPAKLSEDPYAVKEQLSTAYGDIVKKHLGDMVNLENFLFWYDLDKLEVDVEGLKEDPAALKKSIADKLLQTLDSDFLTEERKERMVAAAEERDPELKQRRANIESAHRNLIRPLKRIMENNPDFVKAVKENGDTESVELNIDMGTLKGYGFEKHDAVKQEENKNILNFISSMSFYGTNELYTKENMNARFWTTCSAPIKKEQIRELQETMEAIENKGLDWDELMGTAAYNRIMKENGFRTSEYTRTPYHIAALAMQGKEGVDELIRTTSEPEFQSVMKAIKAVSEEWDKKKEGIYDMEETQVASWLTGQGYDAISNTVLLTNGFEERVMDGKTVKVVDLSMEIDESKINRDLVDDAGYKAIIDNAREAQQIWQQHKDQFKAVFDYKKTTEHSNLGGEILASMYSDARMSDDTLKAFNRFRHLVYGMKAADQDVCRLMDSKKQQPKNVQPLSKDTEFDGVMVGTESDLLDDCIEMLKEPATRVKRNSREYWKIIDSIKDLKKTLDGDYDSNEEARNAYIKGVDKILNNINRYREHKAKDGVELKGGANGMQDKLIALERVDKFLRTRYRCLEEQEFEDSMNGLADLFRIEGTEGKTQNEYNLAQAMSKINNCKKTVKDLQEEFARYEQEMAEEGIKRSNSIATMGTGRTEKLEQIRAMFNGADDARRAKIQADVNKIESNALLKQVVEKEQKYLDGLDPKKEFDRSKLVGAAEKILYIASLKDECVMQAKMGQTAEAEKMLNKNMAEMANGRTIQARAFKFQHLNNKSFNEAFQKKVLEGAEKDPKKISAEDIISYRDAALKECFASKKATTADLNRLAEKLGSDVNSKNYNKEGVKNKIEFSQLVEAEKAANPAKEKKSQIRRSATMTNIKVSKNDLKHGENDAMENNKAMVPGGKK